MQIRAVLSQLLILLSIVAVTAATYAKVRPVQRTTQYVGSDACEVCHKGITEHWQSSLHTKMMRPIGEPGVVVADFEIDAPEMRFSKDEAVWAIGGKWEQQFMGQEDGHETLLPGAWHTITEHWDFTGWDGWQLPIPLKRCHGCHTVGLDVETGEFVEPNIGCESCHGPGEWHVNTLGFGAIFNQVNPQTCGQCHTRGRTPSGEFFFPVDYRPGEPLDDVFQFSEPSPGQNSSDWWGNGRPRRRHQEYNAWRQGGHANALESLRGDYDGRYGAVDDGCLECHAGEYILAGRSKPSFDDLTEGVTCSVCHNTHGDLAEPRMECDTCHQNGAFYHQPERNATHVACPEEAAVGCVGCHMPQTVKTGGGFPLHDHSPGIVAPSDTVDWGTPNSCANGGCHANVTQETLQAQFDESYPSGAVQ